MTFPAGLLDVRLYSPAPGVVIVWVCGHVDGRSVDDVSTHVARQLLRANDVVLDLCHADLAPAALDGLRRIVKEAAEGSGVGTRAGAGVLHLAADGAAYADLVETGPVHPSAAAAIAALPLHRVATV